MVFVPSVLNLGEFLITGNGWFVLVSIQFARKSSVSIAEIEAEFADAITGLRLVPRTGPVSCELWLYNRYGTLRHFRIGDAGLIEIDCYGTLLDQVKPALATETITGGNEIPAPQKTTVTEPGSSDNTPKSDHILRWLKKWNAERKTGDGADATGCLELKKILDAGRPGTKPKRKPWKKRIDGKKGPTVPEKNLEPENLEPEKPVPEEKPDLGKQAPEENPDPGKPAPEQKKNPEISRSEEMPPSPTGAGSVQGGHKKENTPGSLANSGKAGNMPSADGDLR
jgi:hypothetical protein